MKNQLSICLSFIIGAALYGCGGGVSGSSSTGGGVAKSQGCITSACHGGATILVGISPVTGVSIVDEWKSSTHYRMNAAGCTDCHTHSHLNSCTSCHGGGVPTGSDTVVDCLKCHVTGSPRKPLDVNHLTSKTPFTNLTSAIPDNYDSAGYFVMQGTSHVSKCIWCHNPHNTSLGVELKDWSASAHGDLEAPAFRFYDFKVHGTDNATPAKSTAEDCVRCHTATGYIDYAISDYTDIRPWGAARNLNGSVKRDYKKKVIPISNQKQVLYCTVCHDPGASYGSESAYGFKRRRVNPVTAHYNYSSGKAKKITAAKYPNLAVRFPDLGDSSICMACHVGREAGATLKAAALEGEDFTNVGFIDSHYLAAGAVLFKSSGFEFYTSAKKYQNYSYFEHSVIGVNNTSGTGVAGPCIGCHMTPNRHTLSALNVTPGPSGTPLDGTITSIVSDLCISCNKDTHALTVSDLQAAKNGFKKALDALKQQLQVQKGIYYGATSYPYFFKSPVFSFFNAFKNWGTPEVMGAAFDLHILSHEYGAYAHNDLYTKRLIYDSIDFIDDGVLNFSVGATLTLTGETEAKSYLVNPKGAQFTAAERP